MYKIEYNNETLQLIRQLTNIRKKIKLEKKDDLVILNSGTVSESILYQLKVPKEHFNFPGTDCTFLDYAEFYQLFNLLPECDLYEKDNTIIISKNKTKFSYLIADPEIMYEAESNTTEQNEQYFDSIEFDDSKFKFELTHNEINNFKKYIRLAEVNKTKIIIDKNKCTFIFYSNIHVNTFEQEFLNLADNDEQFEFEISNEIFFLLPEKDYSVDISLEQLIRFTLINKEISLEVFTGALEESI